MPLYCNDAPVKPDHKIMFMSPLSTQYAENVCVRVYKSA